MSFQQGLSGLNVSSKALDAIGNNIANSGTVGFKAASGRFADVFAASLNGSGASQIGIGANLSTVFQQFTQGNLTSTNNPLDLAINGGGFFRLSDETAPASGNAVYTRNGQFSLNKDGYVVNSAGLYLTGIAAVLTATGSVVPASGQPGALRLDTALIAPRSTTGSNIAMNLDSRSTPPTSMSSASMSGSVATPTLPAAGGTFTVTIDGAPITVALPVKATTYTTTEIVAAINTAIGSAGTASVDPTTNAIVITSASKGTLAANGATPGVAVSGTDAATVFGTTTATPGMDSFSTNNPLSYTASTSQTVYDSLGNPHNLSLYMVKTSDPNVWRMYTGLDVGTVGTAGNATGAAVPTGAALTIAAATNDTLALTIDGVSATVTIPAAAYATPAALATAMTTAINSTAAFSSAGVGADVTVDGTGHMVITSRSTGTSSAVDVTGGTAAASLIGADTLVAGTGTTLTTSMLQFNSSGGLMSTPTMTESFLLGNGATSPLTFTLDLTGTTQYGASFGVNTLTQDGYTSGRLSGVSVSDDGTIKGNYSNGQTKDMGRLVLANFQNQNGLENLGNNVWRETAASGQPITGTAGQGNLGSIQSAAVEDSNTDLTAELVNMITQQRAYQANAQTIKTQDQILQTLVNLR